MRLKGRRSILVAVLAVCYFVVPGNIFAGAYDGTKINADLNALSKPDHITLSWSDDPATTMTITWRTNSSVKRCKVEYMSLENDSKRMSVISPVQPTVFKTSSAESTSGKMHIFNTTLTGLKPGTQYIYKIGNDKKEWTSFHIFTTESDAEKSADAFKFLLFGDSQSGKGEVPCYDNRHATLHNANKDANFFINVGDLMEKGQYYQHWNNWFKAAEGVIDTIPALVVEGNHETYNEADRRSKRPEYFINEFNLFRNGLNDLKGQVYSYDHASSRTYPIYRDEIMQNPSEKNTSAGELPPPKLNSAKDNPIIGTDLKVVVFGNYAAGSSSTEEEMSREISVDILSIASPAEGSYDAVANILTINEKKYHFKDNVLTMAKAVRSPSTPLSILASPADTMRGLIWFVSKDKLLQACL